MDILTSISCTRCRSHRGRRCGASRASKLNKAAYERNGRPAQAGRIVAGVKIKEPHTRRCEAQG